MRDMRICWEGQYNEATCRCKTYVAGHAPGGAPRVLYDPIILSTLHAVADGQHTVIELRGAAAWLIVDALGVELEALVRRVDGHRHGTDRAHSSLERSLGVGDILEAARGA